MPPSPDSHPPQKGRGRMLSGGGVYEIERGYKKLVGGDAEHGCELPGFAEGELGGAGHLAVEGRLTHAELVRGVSLDSSLI